MKVTIQYFKPSGKYYSEGEVDVPGPYFHNVVDQVRALFRRGQRPGLVDGELYFTAHCMPEEGDCAIPFVVTPAALAVDTHRAI